MLSTMFTETLLHEWIHQVSGNVLYILVKGKSSVWVMCLKYRIIIYFKHIAHTHCSNHHTLQMQCYVIIPKPMTAVAPVQVVEISACRWRSSIYSRCSLFRRFEMSLAINWTLIFFAGFCFFAYTKAARPNWEANAWEQGMTVDRYEQFEISLETIEQELRSVICEQRQTDKENYIIDINTAQVDQIRLQQFI